MKGKRAGAGVTVCDGKIYVAGESDIDDIDVGDVAFYEHSTAGATLVERYVFSDASRL